MPTPEECHVLSKLLNYQIPHFYQMVETMKENNCILDASDTGTGKTYTAIALCTYLKKKPFIICPKSVIPTWITVANYFKIPLFAICNYELLKGGKYYTENLEKVPCPYMDKVEKMVFNPKNGKMEKKITFEFQLPPNDVVVVFDEAHRCKNYGSMTSQLFQSVVKTKCKILLLSATISDKINCFKPFGLAFGFYAQLRDYNMWMKRQIKMRKLQFMKRQIADLDDKRLTVIHENVFPQKGSRMKILELGDLFPKNNVISQSYFCSNYKEVQKEYDIINDSLEDLQKQEDATEALGKIIKARQRIEMYKVPIFIDLAEEALDNGYSVAIFLNYLDTLDVLCHHLKCDCTIQGGQTIEERQMCIDDFQSNKAKVIISIIQAGGIGVSLHDVLGGHPRMSLISPTWSGQDIKQALGRIHRAKSQSPAIQKIVYCARTYEDKLAEIIDVKIKNIDAINDHDLLGNKFSIVDLKEIPLNSLTTGAHVQELKKSKKKFEIYDLMGGGRSKKAK